ncbi:MAG: tungstate ABC transporter substrate-binding protein WtpA [Candidatus Verstraetearchaeota archaeon]|nr:tungstate ABC transporter substrate-binding protein WtpA [Candidatus Verstraetearchaeota archaeon]
MDAKVAGVIVAIVITATVATSWIALQPQPVQIKVFHAGSLTIPLQEVKEIFEKRHRNVEVLMESSGSVEAVRKVTELGKLADIVAVADWLLLKNIMYPEHADFYIKFATNQLVLAYTDKSKYANQINSDNWYEILKKEDVRFAFSDPNKDPCGYRAAMVFVLAQLFYNEPNLFNDLIAANTNMKLEYNGTHYIVLVPSDLAPTTDKIKIRSKSVELLALLEEGVIDYAFEYKSVAVQHNLKYVELPPAIHLGDPSYEDFYKQVLIKINAGTDKEKVIVALPIIYGITMPKNAPHKDLALEFIKLVLSDEGKVIFMKNGQPPLETALGYGNIPDALKSLVATPS